jgi:hypothetical protein
MKDISDTLDHYRICARELWNTAFWPDPDLRNWDSIEQFDEIQRILFSQIVLAKLGQEWPIQNIFRTPIPFLRVVPSIPSAPIMIQNPRVDKPTGYWDHPVNRVSPDSAELHFLAYFDWNRPDYVDFRYYLVKIQRFGSETDLAGREALIERQHAEVHLETE